MLRFLHSLRDFLDAPIVAIFSTLVAVVGMFAIGADVLSTIRKINLLDQGAPVIILGPAMLFLILLRSSLSDALGFFSHPRRIVAGLGHEGSPYYFSKLLDDSCEKVIITAQNLRTLLSDANFLPTIGRLLIKGRVTIILTTYETMKAINPAAVSHFIQTVKELRDFVSQLNAPERDHLKICFHPGAASLSVIVRDPHVKKRACVVFTPKCSNDEQPGNRIFCFISKHDNEDLFNRISGSTDGMRQADSISLDTVIHELGILE